MEIVYRKAEKSDYQGIQKLYKDIFGFSLTEDNYCKYLEDKNHTIWIAVCEECCGSICVEKNWDAFQDDFSYFLRNIGVASSQRKQGICTELLKRVIGMAQQENIKIMELTSANYRQEAHDFYLNHGFTIKKTTVFIHDENNEED